jgi:hypothetical protein
MPFFFPLIIFGWALVTMALLLARLFVKDTPVHRLFKSYANLSCILGICQTFLGLVEIITNDFPGLFGGFIVLWQYSWHAISLIAIYLAPKRLCALPLTYIIGSPVFMLAALVFDRPWAHRWTYRRSFLDQSYLQSHYLPLAHSSQGSLRRAMSVV